jgi:hypothetical protein
MSMYFWTDPHLGLSRTSHTTPASRRLLQQTLYLQAKSIVEMTCFGHANICLGDLFDSTENEEAVIAQGAEIAEKCSLVLSGNHDLANRDGKLSSLALMGTLSNDSPVAICDDTIDHFRLSFPECYAVAIPHKRTQELFDGALAALDNNRGKDRPSVLLLHCNYDSGYAKDEATLNLTREQAGRLVELFDYVLLGHEHIARSDFDGRLQILGNIRPTSFSDISDKYVWVLDNKGILTPELVWNSELHKAWDWETFLSGPIGAEDPVEFLEITGTAPAARLPDIAREVQKFWAAHPETLMVRNIVKAEAIALEQITVNKALDVPTRITEELQGTPLAAIWQHYLGQIQ